MLLCCGSLDLFQDDSEYKLKGQSHHSGAFRFQDSDFLTVARSLHNTSIIKYRGGKKTYDIFYTYVSYNNIICARSLLVKEDLKVVTEPFEVIRGD